LVDFTLDAKPFHTKILSAGIQINFSDDLNVAPEEDFFSIVHLGFNLHTDNCDQPPDCCVMQGLETTVLEDLGIEMDSPIYSIITDPRGLDINPETNAPYRNPLWYIGLSSGGVPVFYDFPMCDVEPTISTTMPGCEIGFEVYPYETTGYEFGDPLCEVYCEPQPACETGLERELLESNLLESGTIDCEAVCGYQPSMRIGLELGELEEFPIEYADPLPTEIWSNNYHGPCTVPSTSPCPDISHTTVSAAMVEFFQVIEDGVLLLEIG
jgi:hypothetical protein